MNMICRCGPRSRVPFRAHVVDARPRANRGGVASDPTGTLTLQRRFTRDLDQRWAQLRKVIPDALSARLDAVNMISHASITGDDPVRAFQTWLDSAMQMLILGSNGSWTLGYVRGAGDIALMRANGLARSVQDGIEDEPRDENGRWTMSRAEMFKHVKNASTDHVYHGTGAEHLDAITETGHLAPSQGAWSTDKPSVHFASDPLEAVSHATINGKRGALFRVKSNAVKWDGSKTRAPQMTSKSVSLSKLEVLTKSGWTQASKKRSVQDSFTLHDGDPDQPRDENGRWVAGGGYDLKDPVDHELLMDQTLSSPLLAREEDALNRYSENDYYDMNAALRAGLDVDTRDIDSVFARASTPVDMKVYRQVDKATYDRAIATGEYHDKAFVSTTADRSRLPSDNVLTLQLPQGSRAIPIGHLSSHDATEAEVLIDRNQKFKIIRGSTARLVQDGSPDQPRDKNGKWVEVASSYQYNPGDDRARANMTRLAARTLKGEDYQHLHPGEITVYRAGKIDSRGSSFTKSKAAAMRHAEHGGSDIHALTLKKSDPAIDVNKLNPGSLFSSEREVFVDVRNVDRSRIKVHDEFNPDQPRDKGGQWTGHGAPNIDKMRTDIEAGDTEKFNQRLSMDNEGMITVNGPPVYPALRVVSRKTGQVAGVLVGRQGDAHGDVATSHGIDSELVAGGVRHKHGDIEYERGFVQKDPLSGLKSQIQSSRKTKYYKADDVELDTATLAPRSKHAALDAAPIIDRIPALQTLAVTELQGIMEAVSQQAVRTLANGLLTKQSPNAIARQIQQIIDKTGVERSHLLTSFICVRAHSAVTLDAFRAAGVLQVGTVAERVRPSNSPLPDGLTRDAKKSKGGKLGKFKGMERVEVLTAGDDNVCLICEDISEAGPYDLDDAEMLIPAHPRCRCAFVPAYDKRFAPVHDAFNPDQQRDKDGKWTRSAGSQQKVDEVVNSLREYAEQSKGSLRERLVVMDRLTGEILNDHEQELELDVASLSHRLKEGSGFSNRNWFNEKGEYHPDNSVLDLHTHPIDQSFSDGDWRVFSRQTIGEMKVISHKNEFTLTKTPEFLALPWQERTPAAINKVYNKHLDAISDRILKSSGTDVPDDFVDRVIAEVNVETAKEFHVNYHIKPIKKKSVKDAFNPDQPRDKDDTARAMFQRIADRVKKVRVRDDFNEGLHPRDKDGKFAEKGEANTVEKLKSKLEEAGVPFWHHEDNSFGQSAVLEIPSGHKDFLEVHAKKLGLGLQEHSASDYGDQDHDDPHSFFSFYGDKLEEDLKLHAAPDALDMSQLTKVGEQKGSNPGGVYEQQDPDLPAGSEFNKKYYIKQPATPDHVVNELLAAKLYQLAGAPTMTYVPVKGGAHVATVLSALDKNNVSQLDVGQRGAAQHQFAIHAWLANWDAVGTGGDNQVVVKGEHWPTTVDVGGALKYRAQGGEKGALFGDKVTEINTLRDPSKNADAAALYGNMTNDQIKASIARVQSIPDQTIADTVTKNGGDIAMATKLIARKHDLAEQAAKMGLASQVAQTKTFGQATAASAAVIANDPIKSLVSSVKGTSAERVAWRKEMKTESDPAKRKLLMQKVLASFYKGHGYASGQKQADLASKLGQYAKQYNMSNPLHTVIPVGIQQQLVTAKSSSAFTPVPPMKTAPDFGKMSDEEERQYWYGKHVGDHYYMKNAENDIANKPYLTKAGLTTTEVAYIRAFTGSHSSVNSAMRDGVMDEGTFAFKHIMNDALDKLPKYEGDTVWRKINLNDKQRATYVPGQIVHWQAFSSTSKKPDQWNGNTHFIIRNPKSGVDVQKISSNPSEAEVIMPADTYYRVLSKKQETSHTKIELEEVLPFGKKKKVA